MSEYKGLGFWGLFTAIFIGNMAGRAVTGGLKPRHYFPATNDVKAEYAVPSKLEIKVEDLDKDGKKETVLEYNKKYYLLKVNKEGKPMLLEYVVRPAEIEARKY